MLLSRIAGELNIKISGPDVEIGSVEYDSRGVKPGSLFCCVVGLQSDGHDFAAQAVKAGAVALLCERPLPLPLPQLIVPDSRKGMASAAACFNGHPEREMKLLGITGTNGKTSTAYMVRAAAQQAGKKVGLIGTIENRIGDEVIPAGRTTPESADLYALLRRMANAGVEIVVMEVSSHALAQERVHGLVFNAALFTNLTQDHLDYHKDFDDYLGAKKRLFSQTRLAILNADDPSAETIARGLPCPVQRLGIHSRADYQATGIEIRPEGVRFHLRMPGADAGFALRIPGLFTVYNAMGAVALLRALDIPLRDMQAGLEALSGVSGRLEAVPMGDCPFSVYVDYAHTPDALENVLRACRDFAGGRLFALFGCGGDRDKAKRPLMGEAGGKHADFVVLTSDNPRSEEPMAIIRAIEPGTARTGTPYMIIENRRDAIFRALDQLQAGDILVIAGKGHESYQEISGIRYPFADKEIVVEWRRRN